MFFQQGPAQTTGYMILGFAVILGMMLVYIVSLVVRNRNLARDKQMLDELESRGKKN
jgi:hypothetical protein